MKNQLLIISNYYPVSQKGKTFIRFSIFSKVGNMFEFDFDPNHQIKKIDSNQVGNDINIYKKKPNKQTHLER